MQFIDGKACAGLLLESLEVVVSDFQSTYKRSPRLNIIRISDDFASKVYTKTKMRVAKAIGIEVEITILPEMVKESEAIEAIKSLNNDDAVDGIILQLPLPEHLSKDVLLDEISPNKDVDGISKYNMGCLVRARPNFIPCTPQGLLRLAKYIDLDIKGLNVIILGQSIIVGRPAALVFLNMGATVTVCHSATKDLEAKIKTADILISAMGATGIVNPKWIKSGAVVFDVGINRNTSNEIQGDIDQQACNHVGFVTPVPGGVGPMTVACLQFNTVLAAINRVDDKHLLEKMALI